MRAAALSEPGAKPAGDATAFKAGMRRLASGVSLVTSLRGDERVGLAATSVCSLSLEPPTLLVCIRQGSSLFEAIGQSGILCVNVLRDDQAHLVEPFGSSERRHERFASGRWTTFATGAPVLADALAAFDCRVVETIPYSTHAMILGVPQDVLLPDPAEQPLVHFNRRFRPLG